LILSFLHIRNTFMGGFTALRETADTRREDFLFLPNPNIESIFVFVNNTLEFILAGN
jgi:hypothetical protein